MAAVKTEIESNVNADNEPDSGNELDVEGNNVGVIKKKKKKKKKKTVGKLFFLHLYLRYAIVFL